MEPVTRWGAILSEACSEILADIERLRASFAQLRERLALTESGQDPAVTADLAVRFDGSFDEIARKVKVQAEVEKQSHEDFFREMVEFLPEAVFRTDADLCLVYANPIAMEMLSATPFDIANGLSLLDFIDETDHTRVMRMVGELGMGRLPEQALFKTRRRDGSVVYLEAVATPIFDPAGGIAGIWGAGRDVTQRVQTETIVSMINGLRHTLSATSDLQEALEQVLDTAMLLDGVDGGCIYAADPESGDIKLAAPRGLSPEFVSAISSRGSDPNHGGRMGDLGEGKAVHINHDYIVSRSDSVTKYEAAEGIRAAAMLPIMHSGRPLAVLVVSTRSYDEIPASTMETLEEFAFQLRGPIERIRAEQARSEVVDTLQSLIATAPLAIYSFDLQGNVTMWNAAAEKIFGWSESEVLGSPPPFIPEESLPEFQANVDAVNLDGPLEPMEVQRLRRDGLPVFLRVSRARLYRRGRLVGQMAVAEDVTEKKRAEDDRLRLTRLESLGVLAGGIAHDFNNLLMGVQGNVSLARNETDPAKLDELLSGVEGASEKAVGLTRQLLTFAKGGAPAKEFAVLNDLVEDVAGFTLSGFKVRADYSLEETWTAEVDLGQIAQVIQNLVINAREAIRGDTGKITISTRDRTEPTGAQFVEIAVSDTGIGVPARIRDQIFDPYFSTKKAGSGLGLSVAYSIVARHGGKIEIESTPRVGTTFRVLLPAHPGAVQPQEPSKPAVDGGKTPLRVLVVDDEEMVRKILVRMLSMLNHESIPATSGDEAVEIVQAAKDAGEHFDLVIMDLTMPGSLGGIQATAALLKIDPEMKVIVSSGYSDDPAVAEYDKYGFAAALQKPYTLDALRATLERIV